MLLRALLLLLLPLPLLAADLQRERALYEQIQLQLEQAEVVWLEDGPQSFPAVYAEHQAVNPKGAVLLLHDVGEHADWSTIIRPLRYELNAAGWSVLSLSMPVPAKGEPLSVYGRHQPLVLQRITAAVAWLKEKKLFNLVFVGHGIGGAWAVNYVATNPDDKSLVAIVGISISTSAEHQAESKLLESLEKLKQPFLEVVAERDKPSVLSSLEGRRKAVGKSEVMYQQRQIRGAEPHFQLFQQQLSKTIRGWLSKNAAEMEVGAKIAPATTAAQ